MSEEKLTKHVVKSGECLIKIARQYGFNEWEPIYEHEKNAALREKRPDPNRLLPGDEIFIPIGDLQGKTAQMQQRNTFVVKRNTVFMSIQLKRGNGEILGNMPYTLDIRQGELYDSEREITLTNSEVKKPITVKGSTDADGLAEQPIPIQAEYGVLTFYPYQELPRYKVTQAVKFGYMPHHDSQQGRLEMLKNRGYFVHQSDYDKPEDQVEAVKAYKSDLELAASDDWKADLTR